MRDRRARSRAAILTTLGCSRSPASRIGAASVAMSTAGSAQRRQRRADRGGIDQRQIALQIDDDIVAPLGIEQRHRLVTRSEPEG